MAYIGIFAAGRNGSTLLGRLLDGIPGVSGFPVEVDFLAPFNDLFLHPWLSSDVRFSISNKPLRHLHNRVSSRRLWEKCFRFSFQTLKEVYLNNLKEDLPLGPLPETSFLEADSYSLQEFFDAFFGAFQKHCFPNQKTSHFLFKTIEINSIEDYQSIFSDFKFIHIIRNPWDYYESHKRTLISKGTTSFFFGWDNLNSLINRRWISHARYILKYKDHPQHLTVRYEDLMSDPVATIIKICDFLKVPLPQEPNTQTVLGGYHMKKIPSNVSQPGVEMPLHVDPHLKERVYYDRVLTSRDRATIAYKTKEWCSHFGYDQENNETVQPNSLLKEYLRVEPWEFENCHSPLLFCEGLLAASYRRLKILSRS